MLKHKNIHIHPGEILLEDVIKPAGLTISKAAELLRVSRLTLSKIVNKRGSISPNIALRIEAVFGGKADFWLRLQRIYDLEEARENLSSDILQLDRFNYS
ncbi:MAG: HigA family addiction module antitoxin [Dysgonamonadaceae bacterium]|jgi:addiction module HigA family antidote|nr:HigA family addiction module antitoxin [Dysgonamonadaceae bacterium]MDD3356443.1 HigA family addiction module antitoxin [Dysgonamonadaceae bacterium]MDD3727781.1 HigA family addiction module antitoxin [Dysgonamonadaceae bacterium]MDD4246692.1 HigA family addiction module antitoxin [Dysgonamonadaceae bacterium]MDD4606196.1 HigA family addiction module antitoxin [Dysgonamonadaceae bacterium]